MRHCQIQCNFGSIDDLCKLGKGYTALIHYTFHSRQNSETYYMPFYHKSLQSYMISKAVRFFTHSLFNVQ